MLIVIGWFILIVGDWLITNVDVNECRDAVGIGHTQWPWRCCNCYSV